MKRIFVFGLLLVLSLGCMAQNSRHKKNAGYSQFYDCADFKKSVSYDKERFVTVNLAYGVKPSLSFGLTYGVMRRFGWFVSVMSGPSFRSFNTDGTFNREDASTIPFVADNAQKSNTRISLMLGGLMKLSKPLALRVGVGYGINELCYKTADDTWFLDKKYSIRGLDMSLGFQLNIRKMVISADAVATDFDMLEAKFGVGYRF